ncbi:MAG: hypothetical protein AAGD22_17690 [Verrucomicrobiota bacterium]
MAIEEVSKRRFPKSLKWAIWLCALSFMLLGVVLAPIAIVLSIIAIRTISKSNETYRGRVAAIVIIPICLASIVFSSLRLHDIYHAVSGEVQLRNQVVESIERAKMIRDAAVRYAEANEGRLPGDLDTLVSEGYLANESEILSPLVRDLDAPLKYELLVPNELLSEVQDGTTGMIIDPTELENGRTITVYGDGSGGAFLPDSQ